MSLDDWWYESEMDSIKREKMRFNGHGVERFCDCPELIVNGGCIACPPFHCCDYVKARSALVSGCVDAALRMPGKFMKNFCAEMERRASPLLRQSSNGAISPHVDEATSIDVASTPGYSWPFCVS